MAGERYPNQSHVIVVKDEKCPEGEKYAFIIQSQAEKAIKKLTPSGFALWFYIVKNSNEFDFYLSSKDFCNWSGVSRKTYTTYVNKMKDLGFLVPIKGTSNDYYFYADPDRISLRREDDCRIIFNQEEHNQLKTEFENQKQSIPFEF